MNSETFIHRAVPADGIDDLLPNVIDGVVLTLRVLAVPNRQILRLRFGVFSAVDVTEIAHAGERVIARVARSGFVRPWRKPVWAFNQTRERGAFAQGKIARAFTEISARGRFRAVKPAAEINTVQVKLENLLLVEVVLNSPRQKNLEQFAAIRFAFERETVARELLRDRARALSNVTSHEIF